MFYKTIDGSFFTTFNIVLNDVKHGDDGHGQIEFSLIPKLHISDPCTRPYSSERSKYLSIYLGT